VNKVDRIIAFVVAISGIWGFLVPNNIFEKIAILIGSLFISLIIIFIEILLKHKKTLSDLKDSKRKHKALSKQFDNSQSQLARYKISIDQVKLLIIIAVASNERDRLRVLLDSYFIIESQLSNGGN
jgi:hypothetical protein